MNYEKTSYETLDKLADNLTPQQTRIIDHEVDKQQLYYWWIMSFEEHLQSCDMCTLTWSDEYCDDYKILLKVKNA